MPSTPPDGEGASMIWWSGRHPPADPATSFAGKTVLITGANTGLGFSAALKFAVLGASRLIFGVRSLQRGEAARDKICQQTGYDKNNIRLYEVDMSTFDSVKTFGDAVSKEPRIDIAILNAGVVSPSFRLSPEGYEMCLQVMVLSTALMAILLLPQLQKSAIISKEPTHLELVGSIAGRSVKVNPFSKSDAPILDQANQPSLFGCQRQYQTAKLFLFYILEGLVEETDAAKTNHKGPGVIINMVCPGPCRTTLGRDFSALLKIPMTLIQMSLFRTAEQGARSFVSGVTLGLEAHGKFWFSDMFYEYVFHSKSPCFSADSTYSKGELVTSPEGKALQKKVWQEIVAILRPHLPGGELKFSRGMFSVQR
ncbi:hypothetical protein N7532_005526 [Penicillium argentinense]|uniref:Uncharacterized protein n=1 Tax=Penicillium argentinense TaxID=1131581 RepID=A0A9W9FE21_9EURO|nr:uncharacterized protein N7532_005526 [Penicillium argentinense]KAJ5098525.1 hypothetical protein N7532_005526 [Penicillium argentinense]